MPTRQISLDEASWRLEQSGISGSAFAELLVKSPPLLLGLSHGNELRDSIDLSGVTGVRIEPDDIVVAENVMWTKVQVDWMQLRAAFKKRGQPVSWWFACNITPERLERSRRPDLTRLELMRSAQRPAPASPRRASPQWFAKAGYQSLVSALGKAPSGKRGPKSGKRENVAAAMRKDLSEQSVTVDSLGAMPEKELAHRYGVSRDTARKARTDVLGVDCRKFDVDKRQIATPPR